MTMQKQIIPAYCRRYNQAGFTLVEIMVGLVIGLLATLVIMQVLSIFEAQKRTTTGAADAQTNGSVALYRIERDVQLAGYPLMPTSQTETPLTCTKLFYYGVDVPAGAGLLAPVVLTDGGTAKEGDTITIHYGTTALGGAPTPITNAPVGNDVPVANNLACRDKDATLISRGAVCSMANVSGVPAAGTIPLTVTLTDLTNATKDNNLACLGEWHQVTYRVNNGNLEIQDTAVNPGVVAAGFTPVMASVVMLQAQYGIADAANSNRITAWVDATGIWSDTALTVTNRNRIKAVRIAVVARNERMEPTVVTGANCGSTDPAGVCSWAGGPAVDLSAYPDWQKYRYRVFDTIVPLRNVIWAKGVL